VALHRARVIWHRGDAEFSDNRYSRAHDWHFDGGVVIRGSSSPSIVPVPYSAADGVDPEEAYVASLSSCHMLWFLDLSRRAGFVVDRYEDDAVGRMEKNGKGKFWIPRVELRPTVRWNGDVPTQAVEADIHHRAHENCFIANSVRTEVVVLSPETAATNGNA